MRQLREDASMSADTLFNLLMALYYVVKALGWV